MLHRGINKVLSWTRTRFGMPPFPHEAEGHWHARGNKKLSWTRTQFRALPFPNEAEKHCPSYFIADIRRSSRP